MVRANVAERKDCRPAHNNDPLLRCRAATNQDLQPDHDQALQAMRVALGEEAFAAALAEGRAMSHEQATSLALSDLSAGA